MDAFINNFSELNIKNSKEVNDKYDNKMISNNNKGFQKFNINNQTGNISQIGNMIINSKNTNKIVSNNIFPNYYDKSLNISNRINSQNSKITSLNENNNNNNFNKFKSSNSVYGSYYN